MATVSHNSFNSASPASTNSQSQGLSAEYNPQKVKLHSLRSTHQTMTSAMVGVFQEAQRAREKFLSLIRHQPAFW